MGRGCTVSRSRGRLPPGLPLLRLDLRVLAREVYADRDTPEKPLFRHPWRQWTGVDVQYRLGGRKLVGSRGKTVWYVPLTSREVARPLGLRVGLALKIVKVPVHDCLRAEARRLAREIAIQRRLARQGLAPQVHGLVAVVNTARNTVRWFEHLLHFPSGAVHLATVVEHRTAAPLPPEISCAAPDYRLAGAPVTALEDACRSLGIRPYDLCLGNAFFTAGALMAVDLHKWTAVPEPGETQPAWIQEDSPWKTRARLRR